MTDDAYEKAQFYSARDTAESPHEAIYDLFEAAWHDSEKTLLQRIQELCPLAVLAYDKKEVGRRTYTAAEVEAILRKDCPEWFEGYR